MNVDIMYLIFKPLTMNTQNTLPMITIAVDKSGCIKTTPPDIATNIIILKNPSLKVFILLIFCDTIAAAKLIDANLRISDGIKLNDLILIQRFA